MIEFKEDYRFVGFWFVYPGPKELRDGRRHDWFCGTWLNPDGTLEFHYRFHYYDVPGDPSEGERSWQGMKSQKPVDAQGILDHINTMHKMALLNSIRNDGSHVDFLKCDLCSGPEAVEKLKQFRWFHKSEKMYIEDEPT